MVLLHQVRDLHHLSKVMSNILLIVDAKQAVRNIVVYFLLVLLQSLQYLHLRFHPVRRLLILAQLGPESVEGTLQL